MGNSPKLDVGRVSASRLAACAMLGLTLGSGCLTPAQLQTTGNTGSYAGGTTASPSPLPSVSPSPSPTLPPLVISPSSGTTVLLGQTVTVLAGGGTAPYTYTINSGVGTIDPSTGIFRAGYTLGTATVQATDSIGVTATSTLNVIMGTATVPNDPQFGNNVNTSPQWGLFTTYTDTFSAWAFTTDCRSIPVAVIDTGIAINHPDLMNNLWKNPGEVGKSVGVDDDNNGVVDDIYGANFVASPPSGNVDDDMFHGTHVAGIIGAQGNNGIGLTGVCQSAALMAVKAFNYAGNANSSDVATAINYAILNHAKVINASWDFPQDSSLLSAAVDNANAAGILFVVAAGNATNDNDATPIYPASYQKANVITVAATNKLDQLASFTNYGATTVHIAAPGDTIYSTLPLSPQPGYSTTTPAMTATSYGTLSGSSMAAPMVSGAAALIWSFYPNASMSDIRGRLLQNFDVVQPNGTGHMIQNSRRLNVRKAIYSQ